MRKLSPLGGLVLIVAMAVASGLPAATKTADGPETVVEAYDRAWNAHDARALGALFDEDAVFFSVGGVAYRGRAAIERHHAELFADRFAGSRRGTEEVRVAPDGPRGASIEARWRSDGELAADRSPRAPRCAAMGLKVRRASDGGAWFIQELRARNLPPGACGGA